MSALSPLTKILYIITGWILLLLVGAEIAIADPPEGAVLIDGLAILAGGRDVDELDSIPVLLSDVEFEAALLLLRRYGPRGLDRDLDDQTRLEARRCAILIRLLARQAKQFQEVAEPAEIEALLRELNARTGGPKTMERLLSRFGMTQNDLTAWAEAALMASTQIRYNEEQIDIPSDREVIERLTALDPYTEASKNRAVYEAQRRAIIDERAERTVKTWLDGIIKGSRIRIMR